jgi:hypothetical protein
MKTYIYDLPDWPRFRWNRDKLANSLALVRYQQGRLSGHMEALGFALREEALLNTLTQDVVKTSEIEGEILNADKVRSSIARRLGIDIGALSPPDRDVEGRTVSHRLQRTAISACQSGVLTDTGRCRWSPGSWERSGFTTRRPLLQDWTSK